MKTWHVRFRSYNDEAETPWRLFGVDELTGEPAEYVGEAADALRQLEDDLRPGVVGESQLIHAADHLVLIDEDDFGERYYYEYHLMDPHRRRSSSGGSVSVGRLPVDESGLMPHRFLAEFQDVAAEVGIDLQLTLAHLDPRAGRQVGELLAWALEPVLDEGNLDAAVRNVMTMYLWLFMVGREHCARGYPSPVVPPEGAEAARQVIGELAESEFLVGAARAVPPAPGTTGFAAEFAEVCEDVSIDYEHTLIDLDEEVGHKVMRFVHELLALGNQDDPEPARDMFFRLLSGALWLFRLGRAHAARGYPAPVPRGQFSDLPDTLDQFFDV
ncbi:hypothetical protein [Kineosporia babensis]|uniref:Uncharacterized protein n=1 Tax=Kineosporia babensis TaxID=499548 RepID=A0A9X1NF83_9ACTN|nr:hypothetical protein [Kineosporia babensis]MCD5312965.1 hypothetical protein [Kineosporia babensis]